MYLSELKHTHIIVPFGEWSFNLERATHTTECIASIFTLRRQFRFLVERKTILKKSTLFCLVIIENVFRVN